ncbi:MAG: hypothetical protein LBR28_01190 [Bacteroidales bacterium]|jgi:hypothetical protein|nr:hypothetical protein [Bacteroidales bacterium]
MSKAVRLFSQGNAAFYNWADNFRIGIQDTATSAADWSIKIILINNKI